MYNTQEVESQILEFWKKNKIFEKLREKNKGKKRWSFLDGPITANNPMGVHHAWGRTYKDLFQRFKAMQGYYQRFQNGFDCQGLWVEREEEKDLGLKDKKDIEKFGILNFVNACKKRVQKFSKIQAEQSIRLGYWMDWDNSYYTMSDENNLHNWFLLKTYYEKGWLYKGKDAVPWCWRCGTASSKHDIATEGYKEVTHKGLFMRFPLKANQNEYFLIFTTTPWTVPANVAIAVNPKLDYVKVENEGVKYWIVESRLNEINGKYKILEKVKGKKLKGIEYLMPYAKLEVQKKSPHKVVLWDIASGEEGTGIVHIAPGCGTEDFELGKRDNLPAISPLNESGFYNEGYEEFSLKKYSDVNNLVLEDIDRRNFVYKITNIRHRYPHCWRCGQELVFKLVDDLPEIHRPWIDDIKIKCKNCKKEAERIKDVGDAWLDAGIVPFSTIGPYLENKNEWEKWYPVDLISENIPGQFRGWFNALFWSGVTLTGKAPFKALFGYETLKDEKGEEMHKSKGNAIWFDDAVGKVGADPMRLIFMLQDPSQELRFGYNVLKEPTNNLGILYNIKKLVKKSKESKIGAVEDKWILSKINNLIVNVTEEMESFHPHLAARALQEFWLKDFSRGYIQIIRERLSEDDVAAQNVLREVYLNLIKLCAPFVPFIMEKIWLELKEDKI